MSKKNKGTMIVVISELAIIIANILMFVIPDILHSKSTEDASIELATQASTNNTSIGMIVVYIAVILIVFALLKKKWPVIIMSIVQICVMFAYIEVFGGIKMYVFYGISIVIVVVSLIMYYFCQKE